MTEIPPCPACGGTLHLEERLTAHKIGTFSVAGAQLKFPARQRWWIVCDDCGIEAEQKD